MRSFFMLLVVLLTVTIPTVRCKTGKSSRQPAVTANGTDAGLKDYYRQYFTVGVAVSPRALKSDEAGLTTKEFNSVTPENAMKMGPIHPRENEYNWAEADSIVAFAIRNGMKVRGHNLCWHNQ